MAFEHARLMLRNAPCAMASAFHATSLTLSESNIYEMIRARNFSRFKASAELPFRSFSHPYGFGAGAPGSGYVQFIERHRVQRSSSDLRSGSINLLSLERFFMLQAPFLHTALSLLNAGRSLLFVSSLTSSTKSRATLSSEMSF